MTCSGAGEVIEESSEGVDAWGTYAEIEEVSMKSESFGNFVSMNVR